jgi:hypothetical protein
MHTIVDGERGIGTIPVVFSPRLNGQKNDGNAADCRIAGGRAGIAGR